MNMYEFDIFTLFVSYLGVPHFGFIKVSLFSGDFCQILLFYVLKKCISAVRSKNSKTFVKFFIGC